MKIVCDACGAKYSIADEKVRGKVFKIRCKRCSNIIVVRGNEEEAQGQEQALDNKETRVFDYSGYDGESAEAPDAIWHVVIDQEQIGPLTVPEVAEKFRAGQLDADSYVWQEGFADWERLADVAEFATLAAGGEDAFGGPPVDESVTAQNDPADLFAAAASAGPADPGADLFAGGGAASASGGGNALFGAAPAAAEPEGGDSKLTGQRNENSVLFSLSNLASLASGGGSEASSSSSSSPAATPGSRTTATQEGSGLIDIRSMAQVYLGDSGSPSRPAAGPGTGSIDDLPSFGATSFDAPASPMLLPMAPAESDNKKLLFALMGVIGVLALAAIVLVVMVVKGGGDEATVASTAGEGSSAGEGAGAGSDDDKPADGQDKVAEAAKDGAGTEATEPGKDEAGKGEGGEDEGSKDEPAKEPKETKTATARSSSSSSSSSSSRDRDKPKPRETEPPKETTTASKPAESSAGCDEVTCLVEPNKACCRKYRSSGGSSSKSSSNLPERPSKSDVKAGIGNVMGRVRACGSKHGGTGVVKVRVKVGESGRVESADPSPSNALGDCVASAVKQAKFPKTQRGVTFTYPFRF